MFIKEKSISPTQQLKTFAMLVAILLSSFILFTACSKTPPNVTLHQLDLKHQVANPFRITKYNKQTCSLDIEDLEPFPLSNMTLHGAICLSPEDYTKYKAWAKTECENEKKTVVVTDSNSEILTTHR